jgi:hypothetical protein
MSEKSKKDFKTVTKIYDESDYKSNEEASQGLATTHEQFSDSYMAGDIVTHDPKYQNRENNSK